MVSRINGHHQCMVSILNFYHFESWYSEGHFIEASRPIDVFVSDYVGLLVGKKFESVVGRYCLVNRFAVVPKVVTFRKLITYPIKSASAWWCVPRKFVFWLSKILPCNRFHLEKRIWKYRPASLCFICEFTFLDVG